MSTNPIQESLKPGGAHHLLAQLVGDWEGSSKIWLEPGKLYDASPVRASITSLAGGRYIRHDYRGPVAGVAQEGSATIGWYAAFKRFQTAWWDTWHTGAGIMQFQGSANPKTKRFSMLGSYEDGQGGPDWGWRIEYALKSPDKLVVTHYNITPKGEEAKAVEAVYSRVKGARKPTAKLLKRKRATK